MLKILYVEDYDDMREMVSTYLISELDAHVTAIESANKAIENIKSGAEYNFIVTDYRMPDGTGSDLIEFLADANIPIPVVLFTNTINPTLKKASKNFLGIIEKANLPQLKSVIKNFSI